MFTKKYQDINLIKKMRVKSTNELFDNYLLALEKIIKYSLEYQSKEEIFLDIYQDEKLIKSIKVATIRGNKFNINGSVRDTGIRYKNIKKKLREEGQKIE